MNGALKCTATIRSIGANGSEVEHINGSVMFLKIISQENFIRTIVKYMLISILFSSSLSSSDFLLYVAIQVQKSLFAI